MDWTVDATVYPEGHSITSTHPSEMAALRAARMLVHEATPARGSVVWGRFFWLVYAASGAPVAEVTLTDPAARREMHEADAQPVVSAHLGVLVGA